MSMRSVVPSFYKDRRSSSQYLASVLGSKEFPFPKDVDTVARWIAIATQNAPEAVILDFFAGTGTTAEAVMKLNQQDGGRRQSILVTNNELSARTADRLRTEGILPGEDAWEAEGVFEKVTWPRLRTVTTGVRADGTTFSGGYDENVSFFKLTYEDENLVALGRRFESIAPLLWLKAGARGNSIARHAEAGWDYSADGAYGVLFDVARAREFAGFLAKQDGPIRHLFFVTDSDAEYQASIDYLPPDLRFETSRLYADYLRSFEINGKD